MLNRLLITRPFASLTILRLVLGIVFFAHGAQKVFGWWGGNGFSATMGFFEHGGIPAVFAFFAIMAEFLGGLGLIIGLLGRVAAFGIFCNMIVAILKIHIGNGLFMNWTGRQKGEGFEYHLMVLAMTVVIMTMGSGAWSIDRTLSKSI